MSPTGPVEGTLPKAEKGDPAGGKTVFADAAAAAAIPSRQPGTSGSVGPNLDEALQGKDAAYIEESIVDPTRRSHRASGRASCRRTTARS